MLRYSVFVFSATTLAHFKLKTLYTSRSIPDLLQLVKYFIIYLEGDSRPSGAVNLIFHLTVSA